MAICWLQHWSKKCKEIERINSKLCYSPYHFRNTKYINLTTCMWVLRMDGLHVKLGIRRAAGVRRITKSIFLFSALFLSGSTQSGACSQLWPWEQWRSQKRTARGLNAITCTAVHVASAWFETGTNRSKSALCGRWVGLGTQMRQHHHQRYGRRTRISIFSHNAISWPEITHYGKGGLWHKGRDLCWIVPLGSSCFMQDSTAYPWNPLHEDASYQHAKEYTHYPDYFDWNVLVLPNTHTWFL